MKNESPSFIKILLLFIILSGTTLFLDTAKADDLAFLVADLQPDAASSNPTHFVTFKDTLFFTAATDGRGAELWKSNGTEIGTTRVKDIYIGAGSSNPAHLTVVDDTLFFVATTAFNGLELWKSDGTQTGTVLVKDINVQGIGDDSFPEQLTVVDDTLFFTADDGVSGVELWKSDGTTTGTVRVKDIRLGSTDANPTRLTAVEDELFFTVDDGVNGVELWKSDGTEAGTQLVKDINVSGSSYPTELVELNDSLFFIADDGVHGIELWKSDGSEAGTVLVKDILSGMPSSIPTNLTKVDNLLFFTANDGVYGYELWKSDGTQTDTVLVKDIRANSPSSGPTHLINVNGTLFFQANDGLNGRELWQSDGFETGTVLVKDIHLSGNSAPSRLTNVNGLLFFTADDGVTGTELWRSDGTQSGTFRLADIYDGLPSSSPDHLTVVADLLFFSADDGLNGTELWAVANPAITIQATPSSDLVEAGQTIDYTYWVTNSGNIHLTDVMAISEKQGAISLNQADLAPGEATSGTSTYTIISDDLPGPVTDTITVTSSPADDLIVTATTNTSVDLLINPNISVTTKANIETAEVGQTIIYTYWITNSGNVDLVNLQANDSRLGHLNLDQIILKTGEGLVQSASYTVKTNDLPGPLVNTVTVTGLSIVGLDVLATNNESVNLSPVSPRLTTLYLPLIQKLPSPVSTKKGIGATGWPACDDAEALNAHWYLNWAYFPDPTCGPERGEMFIPRIYGADEIAYLSEAINHAKVSGWLLGFSEPNLPWQGDVSPAQGAILWKQIEDAADAAGGIKLVSPSPNQWEPNRDGLPYGHQWTWAMVDEYQARFGRKPRFDAIAWNIYKATPQETIDYLTTRHNEMLARGYDVPVWVIEYGGRCWASGDETGNDAIMTEVTAWFETTSWIGRYAWFANRLTGGNQNATNYQSCSLVDPNTGNLTPLGRLYSTY